MTGLPIIEEGILEVRFFSDNFVKGGEVDYHLTSLFAISPDARGFFGRRESGKFFFPKSGPTKTSHVK